jgi:hypothetical protein
MINVTSVVTSHTVATGIADIVLLSNPCSLLFSLVKMRPSLS